MYMLHRDAVTLYEDMINSCLQQDALPLGPLSQTDLLLHDALKRRCGGLCRYPRCFTTTLTPKDSAMKVAHAMIASVVQTQRPSQVPSVLLR